MERDAPTAFLRFRAKKGETVGSIARNGLTAPPLQFDQNDTLCRALSHHLTAFVPIHSCSCYLNIRRWPRYLSL